jgi:hypothetical protein
VNITSAEEAEELTSTWLKNKFHDKVKKIRFSQVALENGIWQVKAELDLKTGIMRKARHQLSVSIDSTAGKVLSYKEGAAQEI